jgi:diguanylate cyclase (GGDEF)-like protein
MDALARPDLLALLAHIVGTAMFAGVFLFLYRESRIVYFVYWGVAWALVTAALLFNLTSVVTGRTQFLYPYALLELAFAVSILFAAASVFGRFDIGLSWPAAIVPILALFGYALGMLSDFHGFYALNSLLLMVAYGWNFIAFRRRWKPTKGAGRKLFAASLFACSLFYSHYALLYAAAHVARAGAVPPHLRYHDLYDLLLETLLAFSAMMMWMETQNEQLEQMNSDLAQSRRELAFSARIDPLTGLMNRAALDDFCEAGEEVSGVVAVVDLDNFKDVNDVLGHLTGDEVLANVGNLIKSSIRKDDLAWRWGGDEFVMLFREQTRESVDERLRTLEERLLRFRLRGKGVLPIRLSWGAAEIGLRSLRETLDEADHLMYLRKHDRTSLPKFFGTTA